MCRTCWKECGSPTTLPPEAYEAVRLIYVIYDDSPVGMPLHVQLDDWGVECEWKPWPDHQSKVRPVTWQAALDLCEIMKKLTVEERAAILALVSGYFSP